ncbi:hypothetical protein BJ742DRAFT_845941 [Cladochytrium replicatum]|nr:hypothetical protein BJ742DRAFT_845941 [Cladochytrium replicatum]
MASLCGRRPPSPNSPNYQQDILVSTQNSITVQFQSDEDVTGRGFYGVFRAIDPSNYCVKDEDCGGGPQVEELRRVGTCDAGKCVCAPLREGLFCQQDTTGSSIFTPRELHSATYDPSRDVMYVFGGRNAQSTQSFLGDLLVYNFGSDVWTSVNQSEWTTRPSARYQHFMTYFNGKLLLYGGVSDMMDSNDVWMYDPVLNSWSELSSLGDRPPVLAGSSIVMLTSANVTGNRGTTNSKLYVFGGFVPESRAIIRFLYIYDIDSMTWTMAKPTSEGTYGGSGMYHAPTDSLFFFGGYQISAANDFAQASTFRYSIAAEMWYRSDLESSGEELLVSTGNEGIAGQPVDLSRSFSPAIGIPSASTQRNEFDRMVLFGGQSPFTFGSSDSAYQCFFSDLQILDLNCALWTYESIGFLSSKARKGHAVVRRNSTLYVTGGSNGQVKKDMFAVDLTTVLPPEDTVSERDLCRARNWCNMGYYDCSDCITQSYCGWCTNSCALTGDGLISPTVLKNGNISEPQCKGNPVTESAMCPFRQPLKLGVAFADTVAIGKSSYYKFYTSATQYDIVISFTQLTPRTNLAVTFVSLRPHITIPVQSGVATFSALDPRRYAGLYVFSVTVESIDAAAVVNRGLSLASIEEASFNIVVQLQYQPNSRPVDIGPPLDGNNGSNGGNANKGSTLDVTTFVTVFVSSMIFSLALTYIAKRVRDRWLMRVRAERGELAPVPIDPPKSFLVTWILPEKLQRAKHEWEVHQVDQDHEEKRSLSTMPSEHGTMMNGGERTSEQQHVGLSKLKSTSLFRSTASLRKFSPNSVTREDQDDSVPLCLEGNDPSLSLSNGFSNVPENNEKQKDVNEDAARPLNGNADHAERAQGDIIISLDSSPVELKLTIPSQQSPTVEDHATAHTNFPFAQLGNPLSVEVFTPPVGSQDSVLMSMHYAIVFPDAALHIAKGNIPPFAIATGITQLGEQSRDKPDPLERAQTRSWNRFFSLSRFGQRHPSPESIPLNDLH